MADEMEARLVQLLGERAFDRATSLALEIYGEEIHGFLIRTLGDGDQAGDVFSQTVESFWRGLSRFEARCSVRTWLYLLANHTVASYRRSPWNGPRRTGCADLDALVDKVRSETSPWQRTDVKDQWRALREVLTVEDRALLVLRVDRDLAWADIARVTLGEDAPPQAAIARETARLRKRFQLIKQQLRARARAIGLLGDPQ